MPTAPQRRAARALSYAEPFNSQFSITWSAPIRSGMCNRSGPRRCRRAASALSAEQVRDLLTKLRASEECQRRDLVDPVTLLIATGLRRSELLALRWSDFDAKAGTIAVTGKLVRQHGVGLSRIDETKTAAGRRTVPLPSFAVTVLNDRRKRPYVGEQQVIFASSRGTLRDPENFNSAWRAVNDDRHFWEDRKPPLISAPGTTRTCDLGIRRPLLYPPELRRQCAGQSIQRWPVRRPAAGARRFAAAPRAKVLPLRQLSVMVGTSTHVHHRLVNSR